MRQQVLKIYLIVAILAIACFALADVVKTKNVLQYALVLALATIGVVTVTKMIGPVQRTDERAIKRSEEAALTAVRTSLIVGALGSVLGSLLGAPPATVAFADGMMLPAVLWLVAYIILNWRDVE